MIYTIMLVTWITQHTLPGLPCPCQKDFQKALGNSENNFTKATLQSITLKSRQNHAITEYLLACRQFRVHSVVGIMPLLPDCLQYAIIAECLDKSCSTHARIDFQIGKRTWVMRALSSLELSTMIFLAARISSKEAPSLTPSSFSAFSRDISEGRESSAMESFALAIRRKDRCCCEFLLLQDGFQACFSRWANVAKSHPHRPHRELFIKGTLWACTLFPDIGE